MSPVLDTPNIIAVLWLHVKDYVIEQKQKLEMEEEKN